MEHCFSFNLFFCDLVLIQHVFQRQIVISNDEVVCANNCYFIFEINHFNLQCNDMTGYNTWAQETGEYLYFISSSSI